MDLFRMKGYLPAVIISFIFLGGCDSSAQAGLATNYCGISKGIESDPCQVSIYTLAAHPDYFNGKVVRIAGFYTRGLQNVLFFDRDSSENVIFKNSVVLLETAANDQAKLTKKLNKYVEVIGKFTQTFNHPGEFSGPSYGQFLGTLNVLKVGSVYDTSTPYACWDPYRDRSKDPKTVRVLLGETVCNEAVPAGPRPPTN